MAMETAKRKKKAHTFARYANSYFTYAGLKGD